MNTLSSNSIIGPYGKEDTCAKFVIDDLNSIFVFNDIVVPGHEYAFGCWLKSDADGSIIVGDTQFACSAESWSEVSVVFTASTEEFPILFGAVGTYYIYQAKLEKGNTVTDWSPAPEDLNQIVTELSTQITVSENGLRAEFTSITDGLQDAIDDQRTMYKLIECNDEGVTISNGENTLRLVLDNTGISFYKAGQDEPFGFWDGTDFFTGNIVVRVEERAQFGNFAFVPRSDGSLSFLKVGG